jgi:hypothetical protein
LGGVKEGVRWECSSANIIIHHSTPRKKYNPTLNEAIPETTTTFSEQKMCHMSLHQRYAYSVQQEEELSSSPFVVMPPNRPIISSRSFHEFSWIQDDALAQEYCLQLIGQRADEDHNEELHVGAAGMMMMTFCTISRSEQRLRQPPYPRSVILAVILAAVVLRMR